MLVKMEFQTLKDFAKIPVIREYDKRLREEAIKRTKNIFERLLILDNKFDYKFTPKFCILGSSTDELCHYDKEINAFRDVHDYREINKLIGELFFLVEFFNIIEEDLMTNEEINAREHGERGNN